MLKDLLYFDSMITPRIITFVYWIMLLGVAIVGVVTIFSGFASMRYSFFMGVGTVLMAILGVGAGVLVARIYCELMIVLFKMNEALQEMRRR
jgi:hypothetical protein